MEHEHGPTHVGLSQTGGYLPYFLSDVVNDGSEDPVDAIVSITVNSARERCRDEDPVSRPGR